MKYIFRAKGHKNIVATHKNTFEFTKDDSVSLDGDCIIGVGADFSAKHLKELAGRHSRIRMRITAGSASDTIDFIANKSFSSDKELVVRLSEFNSERTLGFRATKSAKHLNRELAKRLSDPSREIKVEMESVVKAVLFDFDDTIEELRSALVITHNKIARKILDMYGVYEPTTVDLLYQIDREFSLKGPHSPPDNYDRHIWFAEYFKRVGIKATKQQIDDMVTLYWRFVIEAVKPMPHAQEVLRTLKSDYKLAVMTDSDGDRRLKAERIKAVGLGEFFDFFITGDDVGINKPDKEFYFQIFKKLKVSAEECIMVGDKPQVDLELAKKLGMKTIWMKHGEWTRRLGDTHFDYVDYEITDLKQLLEIMKEV